MESRSTRDARFTTQRPSAIDPMAMPGLPYPLRVALIDDHAPDVWAYGEDGRSADSRRGWLLLMPRQGACPLLLDGSRLDLHPEHALLLPYPNLGLALQQEATPWQALALLFVGFDELVASITAAGPRVRLPTTSWAQRQLMQLAQRGRSGLGLAAAMRLVAGVVASLVEHNCEPREPHAESVVVAELTRRLDALVETPDANLAAVADAAGITQSHMGRLFRQHLETTPSRYLQEHRMRRACVLLRQLDTDITTIAERLGYGSPSAFGAAFRQATGQTPTQFRNSRSALLWEDGA